MLHVTPRELETEKRADVRLAVGLLTTARHQARLLS
jgi:hypothetical protein